MNFTTSLDDLTFVVSDIETSGLAGWDRCIVEISAVCIEPPLTLNPHNVFDKLVKPKGKITPETSLIHGITDDMVASAPEITNVIRDYAEYVDGKILVFHNAAFDYNIISKIWGMLKLRPNVYILDTLKLSRKLNKDMPHHSLDDLIELYDLEPFRHTDSAYRHRALYDSDMTALALLNMLTKLENKGIFTFGDLFHFHG